MILFGIVLLLFAHIGWGRPVEINPNNFTSNKSVETCEMLVALAGPVMNLILAFIFTIIYYACVYFVDVTWEWFGILLIILANIIVVNVGLGIFNLIPIPPLDGSKIFRRFLPYNAREWIDSKMQVIYIIFMVLWITGLLGELVSPVIRVVMNGIQFIVAKIFSIFI